MKSILWIGLSAGIQGMVFSLSNLVVQSAINSFGAAAISASAAAFTIEINVYCIINALGQAVTTFVSQNYGAGLVKRCVKITQIGIVLELFSTLSISIIIAIFARPLMELFTDQNMVIELGIIRILYVSLPGILNAGIEVLSGALRGYGYSVPPAVIAIVGICGLRILYVYTAFPLYPSFKTLMLVYPFSWACTLVLLVCAYFIYKKKILSGAQR